MKFFPYDRLDYIPAFLARTFAAPPLDGRGGVSLMLHATLLRLRFAA